MVHYACVLLVVLAGTCPTSTCSEAVVSPHSACVQTDPSTDDMAECIASSLLQVGLDVVATKSSPASQHAVAKESAPASQHAALKHSIGLHHTASVKSKSPIDHKSKAVSEKEPKTASSKANTRLSAIHVSATTQLLDTTTLIMGFVIAVLLVLVIFFFLRGGSWSTLRADPMANLQQTAQGVYLDQRNVAQHDSQSSWVPSWLPGSKPPPPTAQDQLMGQLGQAQAGAASWLSGTVSSGVQSGVADALGPKAPPPPPARRGCC